MAEEPEDFREFVRSLMAKSDRVLRDTLDGFERSWRQTLEESDRAWREALERSDRHFEAVQRELAEHRRESWENHRASREALMRMLDRLPPPGSGPEAGPAT